MTVTDQIRVLPGSAQTFQLHTVQNHDWNDVIACMRKWGYEKQRE